MTMVSMDKTRTSIKLKEEDRIVIEEGRRVIRLEAAALEELRSGLDENFAEAVRCVASCEGKLVFSGMGKAGVIAQKVAATFSSLGKSSFFMHPGEASHGDLGMLGGVDLVIFFSNSGETPEITAILPPIKRIGVRIVSITATMESTLGRKSDIVLVIGKLMEACSLGLAPTTSTTTMLALGDALAMGYLKKNKDFTERTFALYHPGGSLGRRFMAVSEVMRTGDNIVTAQKTDKIQDVLLKMTTARVGSAVICNEENHVIGLFSDGDLRRALKKGGHILTDEIELFMSKHPKVVHSSDGVEKSVEIMKGYKIGEIPVVKENNVLIGLLCLKDVV
ncbi:arabinose 5-phosphate isomerase KdsD [Spirochaetota bacterium]|nr:arabinose 5-phosphate isomerase KdsD [Spirochaetota bacterium]